MPANVISLAEALEQLRALPARQRRTVWNLVDRDARKRMAAGVDWPDALPQSLDAAIRKVAGRNPGANKVERRCATCPAVIPPTNKRGRPRVHCPDCGGKPWRTEERQEAA